MPARSASVRSAPCGARGNPSWQGVLLDRLAAQGFLADDRVTSIWGQPVLRAIAAAHEPQTLMDATALQRRLVECAWATPALGENRCAGWVARVFARLRLGLVAGDVRSLYQDYCPFDDLADLKVGMILAVPSHPFGLGARGYGHVGLYVGDGVVMDCVSGRVRRAPLEPWMSAYGLMAVPRWGWLASIALDVPAGLLA